MMQKILQTNGGLLNNISTTTNVAYVLSIVNPVPRLHGKLEVHGGLKYHYNGGTHLEGAKLLSLPQNQAFWSTSKGLVCELSIDIPTLLVGFHVLLGEREREGRREGEREGGRERKSKRKREKFNGMMTWTSLS